MDILRSVEIQLCVVEKQSTRPGQGIVSAGKIMFAYGQILTCLIATKTPHRIVTPSKWKRDAAVPSDKDGARRMAQQFTRQSAQGCVTRKMNIEQRRC